MSVSVLASGSVNTPLGTLLDFARSALKLVALDSHKTYRICGMILSLSFVVVTSQLQLDVWDNCSMDRTLASNNFDGRLLKQAYPVTNRNKLTIFHFVFQIGV